MEEGYRALAFCRSETKDLPHAALNQMLAEASNF
jgi:hypothetical protein